MLRRLGLWAVPILCAVVAVTAPSEAFAPERASSSSSSVSASPAKASAPSAKASTAPIAPDFACRKGQVSITFDDGPHPTNTPRLLRILRREHAQASFFMTGQNASRYPSIVRAVLRDGHAVENHSWDHPYLTSLSKKKIRSQLRRTSAAIRQATGRAPRYVRPPYGATSQKVRAAARKEHLSQELWTIDTRDWSGLSVKKIRARALRGLHPHRSNVILMHDAVTNSPRTLKAVPAIIHGLRKRGYCLVPVEVVTPPVTVRSGERTVAEPARRSSVVALHVWLDDRTPQRGAVRATLVDGSAKAGRDYAAKSRRIVFGRGGYAHDLGVRILANPEASGARHFWLRLDRASALRVGTRRVKIVIRDAQAVVAPTPQQLVDQWASPRTPSP